MVTESHPNNSPPTDSELKKSGQQTPTCPLAELIHLFDVQQLGDGDIQSGLNVLAAMALSISSIAPQRSGIRLKGHKLYSVGSSFLVSGSLSCSLVSECTLSLLSEIQHNILDHLVTASSIEEINRTLQPDADPSTKSTNILQKMASNGDYFIGQVCDDSVPLLADPPSFSLNELHNSPNAFWTIPNLQSIDKLQCKLQRNKLSMSISLSETKDFSRYARLCNGILDGTFNPPNHAYCVQGNFIARDPSQLLNGALERANFESLWLGRAIWLVDSAAGPDAPGPRSHHDKNRKKLDKIHTRFQATTIRTWSKRISNSSHIPIQHELDFRQAQIQWLAFLKKHENSFPGITGTAKNLLSSLFFGLLELTKHPSPVSGRLTFPMAWELACHIVLRMINYRSSVMMSTQLERNQVLQRKILTKLEEGAHTARDLYRSFGIPAQRCKEVLSELTSNKLIALEDDKYFLKPTSDKPNHSITDTPPINI